MGQRVRRSRRHDRIGPRAGCQRARGPGLALRRLGATVLAMPAWSEFCVASPRLAGRAQELLYQFGVGLAFLGTVDTAGGSRVHPVCPIVCDGELYLLVVPGPK